MSSDRPDDPISAFNQVLSELIDVVQELKQALRKVPEHDELHEELERLSGDARRWASLLLDEDNALGISALSFMPSAAGRQPPNLWPHDVPEDEVRRVVRQHLDQLVLHVHAAQARQTDHEASHLLHSLETDLTTHVEALAEA